MKFENFEELEMYFLNLAMPIAGVQEELPPELFAPIADSFLREFKQTLILYGVEHNIEQQIKEARYRFKLTKRNWKQRIRRELKPQPEAETVKDKPVRERSERINSEAVYAPVLDSEEPRKQLSGQTEADKSSVCLVAPSSEVGPTRVDEQAQQVDPTTD